MDDGTTSVAVINAIRSIVGSGSALVNEHFVCQLSRMHWAALAKPHHRHHQPENTRLCEVYARALSAAASNGHLLPLLHLDRCTGVN